MSPTECEFANEEQEERGRCPTTTTRPAPHVTSTTTTQPPATTAPVTTPLDTCVPLTGLDAVSCRLEQIKGLLVSAPPTAIARPALRRRLLAKLAKLDHLLQVGRAGGRRGRSALRRADHRLGAFLGAITSAANRSRLDLGLTTHVVEFAIDAKAALHPLVAQR